MGIVDTIIIFAVSLLVGGFGIYVGARVATDRSGSFSRALITALIGAIVWGIISFFVGWIPILGALLALVVWVGVINWRYPGGWGTAAIIGLVAWFAAAIVLYVLALVDIVASGALGIPGI
ncbi:hypothetical protein SAMN05421858_3206 [Haladaptatus litoreus]|uniref:Uncharacterized protein n=1 Tax=Haladaptatus litoreus TaxID=553468 RepID=A0A1N7CRR4_9EURY|nr:hypothetical protein [Haladaptatus litoreus]SIR66273.1 hypothetical protein SAMN05421858_3206 [Haladaptatus litoreus]